LEHDHNKHAATIRVLVADHSPFHTELLVGALKRDPDLQVFGAELNAASLVDASSTHRIDIFILSAFAQGDAQRGLKILQEFHKANPKARAVVLLDSSKPESILEAFRAGAKGFFDHQDSSDLLRRCIRQVHEGHAWVSHDQMTLVLEALAATPKIRAVDGKGMNLLSKREVEVVRCLAEGLTNREIAQRIGLSQHTIKNYLFRIFDKLGVSSRVELLFMTLSGGAAPPLPAQAQLVDSGDSHDETSYISCQKAAENGAVAAQLALARMLWSGRTSDKDVIQAYMWFCVAIDQITLTKNSVKKAMSPSQLATAELQMREWLNKSREIDPLPRAGTSPGYETSQKTLGASFETSAIPHTGR
jgi:two-component system, NarL family, nitrate/nitrite response regulator NarL